MALTLFTHADGWTYDYEEDLELTPTPREEVDWKQLPNDVVSVILKFYDLAQRNYWNDIASQKIFVVPKPCTEKDMEMLEYHMNRRLTIRQIDGTSPKHAQAYNLLTDRAPKFRVVRPPNKQKR
jgi:hypothetical protein